MKIDGKLTKFELGQLIYLRANIEAAGVITHIVVSLNGIKYVVMWGDHEAEEHFETELLEEKPYLTGSP